MRALALLLLLVPASASASAAIGAARPPIVTVTSHGGLCAAGGECRSTARITDTTISREGFVSRPLGRAARASLLRAVAALRIGKVRAHPFKGTCPTAYDGQEFVYRFRGFRYTLASCTYDLRSVQAVALTNALLVTLKHS
jgi:hypothetical protein